MILNQAENIMYGSKQVQKVYLGSELVWQKRQARLPVTRGLQTILYGEDYDSNTKIWTDTEHHKSFTGNDAASFRFYYSDIPGVSMTSSENIAAIRNGVANGITLYCVFFNQNTNSAWAQILGMHAGANDGSVFKGDWKRMMLNGNFYSGSYFEIYTACKTSSDTFIGILAVRYNPETRTLSAYSGTSYTFNNPVNQELTFRLSSSKQNQYAWRSYAQFIAIGETYHTDDEVRQNVAWLQNHYSIPGAY